MRCQTLRIRNKIGRSLICIALLFSFLNVAAFAQTDEKSLSKKTASEAANEEPDAEPENESNPEPDLLEKELVEEPLDAKLDSLERARLLELKGRYDQAIAAWKSVLEDKDHAAAKKNRFAALHGQLRCYHETGNAKQMRELLASITVDERAGLFAAWSAQIAWDGGDFAEAEKAIYRGDQARCQRLSRTLVAVFASTRDGKTGRCERNSPLVCETV